MRCEPRTLDDIRAMGGNSRDDELRFATAARVSEINLAALSHLRSALGARRWRRKADGSLNALHPLRLPYEMFSKSGSADGGRGKGSRGRSASAVRPGGCRQSVPCASGAKSPGRSSGALDAWAEARDRISEAAFLSVYGSPTLQAAVGVTPDTIDRRKPRKIGPARRVAAHARCRDQVADRRGRFAGVRHSRPALCRDEARRAPTSAVSQRSAVCGRSDDSRLTLVGIQGTGARAILPAADRSRRRRSRPFRRCCRTSAEERRQGACGHQRGSQARAVRFPARSGNASLRIARLFDVEGDVSTERRDRQGIECMTGSGEPVFVDHAQTKMSRVRSAKPSIRE